MLLIADGVNEDQVDVVGLKRLEPLVELLDQTRAAYWGCLW